VPPDDSGAAANADAGPPQGIGHDPSDASTGDGNSTGGTGSLGGGSSHGGAGAHGGASGRGGANNDPGMGASGADDASAGEDGSPPGEGTSSGGGSGLDGTGGTSPAGTGGTHASTGSGGMPSGGMPSGGMPGGGMPGGGMAAMPGDGMAAMPGDSGHDSGGMAGMPGMTGGMGGMGGMGGDMGTGNMGGTGGDMSSHDHCVDGEYADARDALLATPSAPDHFVASNGDIDLPVPQAVLDWMDERAWKPTHDAWHNIRRCRGSSTGGGEGSSSSSATMCAYTELVPEHQECADAQNGFEFLVMHRHMMIALRQAFPAHADLFAGFPHFPFEPKDVPAEWQSRFGSGWTSDIVQTAKTLEDIEHHLDQFPTDGDLGKFIQCGMMSSGASSIHGAMHFKWVVNESPNSLGKQAVNIGNYMFWKLHGWIDGIWERYRAAKGLTDDDSTLKSALVDQCREMHMLGSVINPDLVDDDTDPLPVEHGYFHENVRPALERVCSGCHSESSPEANMSLGGHISSADVVKNLVNVKTFDGGQFYRVVPGQPDQSWVYLKAAALAADAGCIGSTCNTQPMPPGATADERLTSTELAALRQWILDGAAAPTP
jgi:hypothetical protein